MIILDLNHVEVVSEETETSIVGGSGHSRYSPYLSVATGDANALAVGGFLTLTQVKVTTFTAPGFSTSAASSESLSSGY